MLNKIDHKKELVLYSALFLLVYLLFNGSYKITKPIGLNPIVQFQLTGLLASIIKVIFIFVPFVVAGILLIAVTLWFANFIRTPSLRRSLKIISIVILVGGLFVIGNDFFGAKPQPNNNINPGPTTTTSTATSTTTGTNSSETNTNGTLSTSSGINSTIPSFKSTNPLQVNTSLNKVLINILLLLAVIILSVFVIRSFRSSKSANFARKKKDTNTYKDLREKDANSEYIIKEYLQISEELESKGINPDYSLTPVEFENETVINLNVNEIQKITFYYEMARFSDNKISDQDLQMFKEYISHIKEKLATVELPKERND